MPLLLLWHLRAQKQLGLGFTCCFFLLVSPMALLSQQGSLQHRGKQKAWQDRDPAGQGPIALNPRPRQNPQGKPEHPSGSSSPRCLQTRGVSAPSAGSSSSLSSVPDPATVAVAPGSQPPAAVLEKVGTWGYSALGCSLP